MPNWKHVGIWIAAELLFGLICVNVTNAGLLPEEAAEQIHGAVGMFTMLWALGFLRCPAWAHHGGQGRLI